jgi:ribosomal protein L29
MAVKKTTKAKAEPKAKKAPVKKEAAKKAAPKAKAASTAAIPADLQGLDRKGLAARARQLKKELLAIRFNPQAPSLRDYRIKKRELATVLARLSS